MNKFIHKLNSLLTRRDKQFLIFLFFFSIVISMIETVGISAIMPFISVANDFALVHSNEYYKTIYSYFDFTEESSFVVYFGVVLICFYFFRSMINLIYFYLMARFSKGRYYHIAYRLFENYLNRSYRDFIDQNSADMTKAVIYEAKGITSILSSALLIVSEVFIVIFLYLLMLSVNYKVTLALSLILLVNVLLLTKTISKRIKREGVIRESFQKKFFKIINATFGNFKIIKLKSNDFDVLQDFSKASSGFTKSQVRYETFSNFPRLFLEALGFSIVLLIVIYLILKYEQDISSSMAMISMFILGLYRLMPSATRILSSYNNILFNLKSLDIIHNDLIYEIEDLKNESIDFKEKILLKNIQFSYKEEKTVINDISLSISKNEKVAFIGESGSGKSTLVDILIGLYKPKEGSIIIDGKLLSDVNVKQWRKKIGYIPQSIYLFDGTVAQNVAFGEQYDESQVIEALRQANIYSFLESHHEGIDTVVGENGIKLSGGQKQRIAIARALYSNPEILVLDEATSALDTEVEAKIMDEIYDASKAKTLIIIAHRLSTIEKCDKKYKLKDGEIIDVQ